MRNQKLYESVRKYIDKYYIDKHEEDADIKLVKSAIESYAVESIQETKATDTISLTLPVNRNIESLMGQMDETFSQRLLHLIDERGMTDSEAYSVRGNVFPELQHCTERRFPWILLSLWNMTRRISLNLFREAIKCA